MKKLLILLFFVLVFASNSNLSVVNPTWNIIDCVNNFELIKKREYGKYLNILKETDKAVSLKESYIDSKIYDTVFNGVCSEMIKKVQKIYQKEHNPILKKIIFYMKDIKKKAKKRVIAVA